MTADEIAMRARENASHDRKSNPLPQPSMKTARLDALLRVLPGTTFEPSFKDGHYTLTLPLPAPSFAFDADDAGSSNAAYRAHAQVFDALAEVMSQRLANPAKGTFDVSS